MAEAIIAFISGKSFREKRFQELRDSFIRVSGLDESAWNACPDADNQTGLNTPFIKNRFISLLTLLLFSLAELSSIMLNC